MSAICSHTDSIKLTELPERSPAARTAWRSAEGGCTCACANPAATSRAATARRTGTPPPTPAAPDTRSFAPPNPGQTGAGATSITSPSWSADDDAPRAAPGRVETDEGHAAPVRADRRKIRLATTAPRNHWWNAALYVDVRGLTTRRLHHRGGHHHVRIEMVSGRLGS